MKRTPSNVNSSQTPPGQPQDFPRQPRSSPGTQVSTHGRAEVALDPVRDRIDSDWAPGVPDDPSLLPTTVYQALAGRVYTLVTWPDESTVHGEVPIEQLEDLLDGKPVVEGWYSISGVYLGAHPPGSLD